MKNIYIIDDEDILFLNKYEYDLINNSDHPYVNSTGDMKKRYIISTKRFDFKKWHGYYLISNHDHLYGTSTYH